MPAIIVTTVILLIARSFDDRHRCRPTRMRKEPRNDEVARDFQGESAIDIARMEPRHGILTIETRTEVRPPRFTSTWRNVLIARSDVVDFVVGQVDSDAYLRETPFFLQ